jgi:hypothetical protein
MHERIYSSFFKVQKRNIKAWHCCYLLWVNYIYFLYEKQDRDYLCEWKRVSIPFYIFFPCTTA